jgi:hypothetical protein
VALDQLAHAGHAQFTRQQGVARLLHPVAQLAGIGLLHGDGVVQALAKSAVAVQQLGGATFLEARGPALVVLASVALQLLGLLLGLLHQRFGLAQGGQGVVAFGFGALQQGLQQGDGVHGHGFRLQSHGPAGPGFAPAARIHACPAAAGR